MKKLLLLSLLFLATPSFTKEPLWQEFAWLNGSWSGNELDIGVKAGDSPFFSYTEVSWGKVLISNGLMLIDLPAKMFLDDHSEGIVDKVYQADKKTTIVEYHYKRNNKKIVMKVTKLDNGGYRFEATPDILNLLVEPIFYKVDGQIMP